jgi:predicted DNA-binding transcriptional regulator AlpA
MALILPKKESASQKWYRKNKQRRSEERKKLYAENPEYRKRAIEASRKYRRGERTLTIPPEDAPISFERAAERIGIRKSTLHDWHSKKFFPEPKRHNGRRLWFSEKQVLLLTKLKEVIRVYGKRRGKVKRDRIKEVIAFIFANWD